MILGDPHEGEKQRGKSLVTPCGPDGYALSPRVATTDSTCRELSARSKLSTSAPVASSPWVPQTAMSPTAINTGAPSRTSSCAWGPDGVGDAFSSREHATARSANAVTPTLSVLGNITKRRGPGSEGEADRADEMAAGPIGEKQREVLPGIEHADPQSAARRGVPASGRCAIDIHFTGISEPNGAYVQRHDQREFCDRNAELCGFIKTGVTCPALPLLCPERLRSAQERGVEVRKRSPRFFPPVRSASNRSFGLGMGKNIAA